MSNNSKMFIGSVCFTDLKEALKTGHSSGIRSEKNGKVYASIVIWLNGEPDKFGNDASIQLSSTKEKAGVDPRVYIGNAKEYKKDTGYSVTPDVVGDDDLPF